MDPLREYHTQRELPEIFEKAIRDLGLKTDWIFESKYGHSDVVSCFDDIHMHRDKTHITSRTLASLSLKLSDEKSVIACYFENGAGEGTITYAFCTPEKAEQCMKVMNPGKENGDLSNYLIAHDIPLVVSDLATGKSVVWPFLKNIDSEERKRLK